MKSKYKIAFIIPYFGKLPNYFQLWLDSASNNYNIDFYLYTDDDSNFRYPSNVKRNIVSFEYVINKIQKCFDFNITLDSPYKLCDYRPAYGEVFADVLKNYEFWGHCDLDIIWGNFRKFVTDDMLERYDRVFSSGYCSIYKNNEKVNSYYKTLMSSKSPSYEVVYTNKKNYSFDEWGGVSNAHFENNVPVYYKREFADIHFRYGYFKAPEINTDKYTYLKYSSGTLSIYNKEGFIRDLAFVHLEKRKIKVYIKDSLEYYIISPGIITQDQKLLLKRRYASELVHTVKYICKTAIKKVKRMFSN